ncbi:MAG: tandem-95 repeat protein [Deltaproteobacteria bacterium]|nr:tandem-95 repeat protein [Deltaproteobacteria bacterium]
MRRLSLLLLTVAACGFPSLPSVDPDAAPADPNAPVAMGDTLVTALDTPSSVDVLANDSDADGDTLTIATVSTPAHGAASIAGTGITYTPATGYAGVDSFTYTISDGTLTATATVTVTVTNDHAPTAGNDTFSGTEDTAGSVDVLVNDSDIDSDPLTLTAVTTPPHGAAVIAGTKITYTPAANYNGGDSFTYTVSDGTLTTTATVTVNLAAVEDAPVASADTPTTAEDTAGSFDVLANDVDVDGDALSITAVTTPSHGAAAISGSKVSYTPTANYNGGDSFTYTISDGQLTATATVNLTVSSVNDAPVAANDSLLTDENNAGGVAVLANDSDPDADTLSITAVSTPTHGTAAIAGTSVTYTPAANYVGTDGFTYTVSDGHGGTATAMVSVTVRTTDRAPVANDDTVTTPEDTQATIAVTANDTDADGDPLSITSHTNPAHGTAVTSGSSIVYTPVANFHGSDTFDYTISDGLMTATATVTITVASVNDAPVAADDSLTITEDAPGTVAVLANDTDLDGDPLTITARSTPGHGTTSLSGSSIVYTPAANYNGSDAFTYTISDGTTTAIATVSVTVTPVNDGPVAVADSATTAEDTAKTIAVLTNDSDVDGDTLTITARSTPGHGTTALSGSNIVYTPAANYNGSDSFTYTISDGTLTAVATVTMTVTAVNDPPVAVNDTVTTAEDTAKTIAVLANDSDVDGDALTIMAVTAPTHGTAVKSGANVIYAPAANYNGVDSFTYTITDGALTATATVFMTVTSVNDLPVASAASATLGSGESVAITLVASDADNDPLTFGVVAAPIHGTVSISGNVATYTANLHYTGADSFTFRANDGTANSNTATVSITVTSDIVTAVSVGNQFACALRSGGSRSCWGLNTNEQLGDGTTVTHDLPEYLGGSWASLAAGQFHACGIGQDGSLWCWGYNGRGALGDGTMNDYGTPHRVGAGTNWASVAVGSYHTCATRTDGTLWCWGGNTWGEVGTGNTTDVLVPTQVGTATNWGQVSADIGLTCGRQTNGTLWCWGSNYYGTVGDGTNGSGTDRYTPVQIGNLTTWAAVSAGFYHSCAIRTDGTIWCWGLNDKGQLGDNTTTLRNAPTQVGTSTAWASVDAGGSHSCGRRTNGTVWCWGSNAFGQLGDGTVQQRLAPAQVGAATNWASVSSGYETTCALTTTGIMDCWGHNVTGGTGLGIGDANTPMAVGSATDWGAVAGGTLTTCGLRAGSPWCWGGNFAGQLGNNSQISEQIPVAAAGTAKFTAISSGGGHSCAIGADNTLWCWGVNYAGQLGDGTTSDKLSPYQLSSAVAYTAVAGGGSHTCAVRTDGSLWCWGANSSGQLGDGTTTEQHTPTKIGTATNWSKVAAGHAHTCAVRTDGTLWCWGYNYSGSVGDGTTTERHTPVRIGTGTTWANVSLGNSHSCATKLDGTLWCWGSNSYGQLGDGTGAEQDAPGQVGSATTWAAITAGALHTCATRTDSTLWCWGDNSYGQLGDGTLTRRLSPVAVDSGAAWKLVGVGDNHTCGQQSDGTMWCWGSNSYGQLGDGEAWQLTPALVLP